jgi:hypothetical protein
MQTSIFCCIEFSKEPTEEKKERELAKERKKGK